MKVLIVEEALKTLHGHWFQYISDIVNGGKEAGLKIEVAVHKDACPEILAALPCRPILSDSVFEADSNPLGRLAGIKRVLAHNRSLYRDLKQFFGAGNHYDLVIATTPRIDHLLAYECLHWGFRKGGPHFVLIFVESVGRYSADYSTISFSKKSLLLKLAFQWSRKIPNIARFSLVTESEGLARQFEKFCGVKFGLVPHVTHLPELNAYRKNGSVVADVARPRILGTYGFTRYDKGLDLLHSAIRQLRQGIEKHATTFVVQWTGDYKLPDGALVQKDQALESCQLVKYIPGFSNSDEYYRWIAETDVMVLPYRKHFYRDKLSRVAIDAALAGIPLVYPADTWLEWFVENHATGVIFEPENTDSLAQAISEVLARYDELKKLAEARRAATAEAFSAGTFFSLIGKLATPSN